MGRQKNDGLSYFPLDVGFFEDKRIRRLIGTFGTEGAAFYIYILCKVYSNGYYAEYSEDFVEDAALDLGCTREKIELMLHYLSNKSLIDSTLFDTVKVLSSHGIQRQYQESRKGAKRDVEVARRFWILKDSETEKHIKVCPNEDKSEKKEDISENKKDNSEKNAVKEKENKIKENKEDITDSSESVCRSEARRAVEAWNSLSSLGIPPVTKITADSTRGKSLKARLMQNGIDDILKAIENIRNSDFLCGKNKRNWVITFDWFVKPNNFPKVLEGNYNNRTPQSSERYITDEPYDNSEEYRNYNPFTEDNR